MNFECPSNSKNCWWDLYYQIITWVHVPYAICLPGLWLHGWMLELDWQAILWWCGHCEGKWKWVVANYVWPTHIMDKMLAVKERMQFTFDMFTAYSIFYDHPNMLCANNKVHLENLRTLSQCTVDTNLLMFVHIMLPCHQYISHFIHCYSCFNYFCSAMHVIHVCLAHI